MRVPQPRGPLSSALVESLRTGQRFTPPLFDHGPSPDVVHDEDLQLSLWVCYELHYRGFDDVEDSWEWSPAVIAFRSRLESRFLTGLRALAPVREVAPAAVPDALADLVAADDGPSLAGFLQREATLEQFREFVALRSVYHLKEADPHSWAIPRLDGRAKAALVEIQADEYGGGRVERMHSELFRDVLRALDLDDTYGGYVDRASAATLAVTNTISLFGLNRNLTGALVGHLAAFEMTSSLPNRRYGAGVRRLGGDARATRFYDEHVEADAVHEQIAAHDLCGSYARAHPGAAGDVLFGAAACLAVEAEFGRELLDRWAHGRSALHTTALGRTA
ncbi:iron-containing redox enzyme family protein [Actinosynnema sp. NPDC020468]|uniref:iron-containing redox enzyme family protein n=1 Tax=Actinosynnema sp. NPDC020468 TaxID=3154488 RepID=UPI0033DB84C8